MSSFTHIRSDGCATEPHVALNAALYIAVVVSLGSCPFWTDSYMHMWTVISFPVYLSNSLSMKHWSGCSNPRPASTQGCFGFEQGRKAGLTVSQFRPQPMQCQVWSSWQSLSVQCWSFSVWRADHAGQFDQPASQQLAFPSQASASQIVYVGGIVGIVHRVPGMRWHVE